jgi:hypothetical protein
MTDMITVTYSGGQTDVEILPLGELERSMWSAKLSMSLENVPEDEADFYEDDDIIRFFMHAIPQLTDADRELVYSVDMESFGKLSMAVSRRIAGVDVEAGDETDSDTTFNFNDDGSVDLREWR